MGDAADDVYWSMERSMSNHGDDYVTFNAVFKYASEKAVLIAYEDEEHWVPRSVLSWKCDCKLHSLHRLDDFELSVRTWFAEQQGWAY